MRRSSLASTNLICSESSCQRPTCTAYRSFAKRLDDQQDRLCNGLIATLVADLDPLAGGSILALGLFQHGPTFSLSGLTGIHPMPTRCSGLSARYGQSSKREA